MEGRVYLDWNASAPLRRPEASDAMLVAMEAVGNPSSVHAEGRAARALVERSRRQIADAFGAGEAEIVFVSGATEAAALACAGRGLVAAAIEHDAVAAWVDDELPVDRLGAVRVEDPGRSALQWANSETGVVQDLPAGIAICDATQGFGRLRGGFDEIGAGMAILSAHKFGGPKGVGALVLAPGAEVEPRIMGGGQEMGRRSGTENVVGIAGMGAAAEAAARDLADGVWERVAELRNFLDNAIEAAASHTIFVGKEARRLPNTSCFASPGWKAETQVMRMDLAGFAVSAGSACSSGKVRPGRALRAMGFDETVAASAIRVSLGPETTETDVSRFADAWAAAMRGLGRKAA